MTKQIMAIAAYVRNNVEFYEERIQLALSTMGIMRCPLEVANHALFDDISDTIEEWCEDNEVNFMNLDLDELVDEIIWV